MGVKARTTSGKRSARRRIIKPGKKEKPRMRI